MNEELRDELIAMAEEDQRVRDELAATGELFDGYHPRMEEVHVRNARRLAEVLDASGWPDRETVGEEAERAAALIVQHAISRPELMRRALPLMRDRLPDSAAALEDRIRVFEGRRQRYGTQLDWDEEGRFVRLPIEDPETVDQLRASVGLDPLGAVDTPPGEPRPADPAARRRAADEWARSAGWRD
jgi:hypothetical protein